MRTSPVKLRALDYYGHLSSLQVFHCNFAAWVSALEELRGSNRNGFDVAIGARLAVNEDFELSAGWIFNLHLPQSSSATAGRLGLPLRTLRAMIRPRSVGVIRVAGLSRRGADHENDE
jgi:hypothetical protein